jgi:hypothetical protein
MSMQIHHTDEIDRSTIALAAASVLILLVVASLLKYVSDADAAYVLAVGDAIKAIQ